MCKKFEEWWMDNTRHRIYDVDNECAKELAYLAWQAAQPK